MNAEPSKGNDDEVTVQTEATGEDEQPVVAEDGSAEPPVDGELQEPDVQSRAEPDLAESAGVVETPAAATEGLAQGEEPVEVAGGAEGQGQVQDEGSGDGNGEGNGAAVDFAVSENGEAVALAESASSPLSTVMATPAAVQKKFTSLNVNRRFLEKASPTLPAATVPTATNASTPHSSSRLSTITPASRLTSAKLSKAVKLQPAGWGQLAPAASPDTLSPSADPLASAASAISNSDAASTPPSAKQPVVASAPVAASPKLVTALTSGSVNRSTSPQNKGSPGLRNAALAASGRSSTPSVVTPTISSSTKAPWAKVKTDALPKQSALSSDFPTAAEAAKAKQEAERREKAAAAEAAAKAEQALQHLERYRGTSLGAGNHWDEMDDEDDLDEVVQFGDGTQYKVPVKKEDEPVSKEERFKDVGHDRSWPPKTVEMPAAAPTTASSGRLMPGARPSSIRDPVPETGPPSRLVNPRANKVEIRSGEGISLESEAPLDRGYGQREARPFFRRDREGEEGQEARPVAVAPAAAPARAWGPLAQRQATLNPDAPKPAELSSPSATKAAVPSQPVQPVKVLPLSQHTPSSGESGPLSPPHQFRPAPPALSPPIVRSTGSERALPPHLAANFVPPQKAGPSPRSDWEITEPRAAVQATPYESRASLPSAATNILSPTPSAEAVAAPQRMTAKGDVQREEMLSAAERARKRRQEEEDRRQAEKERAKAKAAAIEEKIRLAKEEEEKKRAEAAEKKKIEEDEKRKNEEALARRETEQRSSRGNRPELTSAHLNAANERGGQQRAATMLLSPSDEAVSWRRSRPAAPLVPPGIPASETDGGRHAFKDVRPETADSGRPPLTLLQRSAPLAKASRGPVASHNEHDLASSTGMEGWDVVINRIKDSAPPASSDAQIPTGPRAAKATGAVMDAQGRAKPSIKAPRVEIIAPTDEGAAKQRVAEQRQREARQTQGPPVSVLKSGSASIRAPAAATEGPETRSEVAFDSPPVWNRYKIKVGLSNAPARLPRHIVKAQAMRVASFKNESTTPRPITILTWDPPIGNLSSRTLSRDDLFFPKKYRKGVVITNVSVPTAKLERRPRTESTSISPVVRVPASRRETTREAQWRTHGDSSSPSLAIPKAPASMRAKGSSVAEPNSTAGGLPGRQEASTGGSAGVVSFARSVAPRDDEAPSPVSFTVTSELTSKEVPHVSLPLSAQGLAAKATPRNTLPSPNQMTSTWGQNTLTFAGLDSSESGAATADRDHDHIKNVWATPSGDNGNELAPKQNSLRGIVDDFPSTMALSMQDLKDGDSSVAPAAQYHDVGINTTKAEMHNSANSSRIYLPMASHDKMADGRNGFASMTSSSSPSTARSKARDKTAAVNGSSMSMGKPASRSPSLSMATSFHQEHRQDFSHAQQYSHQHQRGGQARTSSTGFSPYAYPSPIQDYTISDVPGGFVNGQQQRSFAGTHHYAPDDRFGAASGVNAYGPYRGNPISPNMAGMSASAAGWPIDNPSAGYYGSPPSMQQQQAPWNMMMTPQPHHTPHHLRISSSASRLHASTPGSGPMRGAASSHSHRTNPSAAMAGGTKPTGSSGVNSGSHSNANHANHTDTGQREEGQGASSGGGTAGSPSSMRYRAVW